jgi:aspartate kinase
MDELFESRDHKVYQDIQSIFDTLTGFMRNAPSVSYDAQYDAVVSCGELISTKIVSHYLNAQQIHNMWFDARELVQTDNTHREGKVEEANHLSDE